MFASGAAKWEGETTAATLLARQGSEYGSNLVNHSQGNILLRTGLITLDKDVFVGMGDALGKISIVSYGSPVNNGYMRSTLNDFNIYDYNSYVHPHDFVGEGLGRNILENKNITKMAIFEHLGDIHLLSKEKYIFTTDAGSERLQEFSPHSTYFCQIHCGENGERQDLESNQERFRSYPLDLHRAYYDKSDNVNYGLKYYPYERKIPVVDQTIP